MSRHKDTPEELILPSPDGAEWPSTSPGEAATPPGWAVVLDPTTVLAPADADADADADGMPQAEMCCDGSRTAEQHRAESADHKCCVDN